jgi:hypothetical protein
MYFTAYLLVNYFMHMDGKGDGAGFVKYMQSVAGIRRQIDVYEQAVEALKKLPGVEALPGGGYRLPDTLTPPTMPEVLTSPEKFAEFERSSLGILLNGRTTAELMDQIRTAYRRSGIKL